MTALEEVLEQGLIDRIKAHDLHSIENKVKSGRDRNVLVLVAYTTFTFDYTMLENE